MSWAEIAHNAHCLRPIEMELAQQSKSTKRNWEKEKKNRETFYKNEQQFDRWFESSRVAKSHLNLLGY